MEPIVYNNMPNQDPKLGLPSNSAGAGSSSSVINFPDGVSASSIISYAKTRNSIFEKWYNPFVKLIATYHKMWRNEMTANMKGTKPVPLPVSHSIIESINARLTSVIFNRPKYVDALPQQVTADNTLQKKVEDYVNQELKDVSPQPDKGKSAIKALLLDTFIIWRNVWKQCTEIITVPDYEPGMMQPGPQGPMPGQPMFVGNHEETITYEHWDWELMDPEQMAWDPHCTTNIQDSGWARQRTRMSYNQLMQWQQEGRVDDIDQLKTVTPSGLNPGMKKDWETSLREADGDKNWAFSYGDEKEFKVEEWYAEITYNGPAPIPSEIETGDVESKIIDDNTPLGSLHAPSEFGMVPKDVSPDFKGGDDDNSSEELKSDIEDEQEEGKEVTKVMKAHFIIVEDKYIIKFEENPLRPQRIPYGSCPMIVKPRSIMGMSPLEPVKVIQDQINGFASKQNDLIDQATNRLILYDSTSGLTGRTAFSKLNGLVPVESINGIKEFPANPTTVKIIQDYITAMQELMNQSTGANEQFQGAEGADTLGEFQGLVAAAGSRFADVADTINQSMIENMADECFWFTQQFGVDGQMIVRQTGGDTPPVSLTRADFIGQYKFSAVSATTENYHKQAIADDTAFVGMMNQINQTNGFGPGTQPNTNKQFNVAGHLQNVSLPLRGAKNSADQFINVPIPPPPPPKPPDPPRISVALNGQDAAALGLSPAIQQDFGVQGQPQPQPQMMPPMALKPPMRPNAPPPMPSQTPAMMGGPNG